MCLTPIKIKNPNYGKKSINPRTDTVHQFIEVPCGHCPQCIAARQSEFVQRAYMESQKNHIFFATLTYDPAHLPVLSLEVPLSSECSPVSNFKDETLRAAGITAERLASQTLLFDESGHEKTDTLQVDIPYADIHHLQLMFKRMRDNNRLGRPFRYIACTELGSRRGRPHAHILFFVPKQSSDTVADCVSMNETLSSMLRQYWSKNVGTRKHPVYQSLYTHRVRFSGGKRYSSFDCHYVDPNLTTEGVSDVVYYVTKYLFKENNKEKARYAFLKSILGDDDFRSVWNMVHSRSLVSKGLGLNATFVSETYYPYGKPMSELSFELSDVGKRMRDNTDLPLWTIDPSVPRGCESLYEQYLLGYSCRRRRMVPDDDIVAQLKKNALLDLGVSDTAVFVAYNGEHVPLCHYYSSKGIILSMDDHLSIYFNASDEAIAASESRDLQNHSFDYFNKQTRKYDKAVALVEDHDVLSSDMEDFNPFINDSF